MFPLQLPHDQEVVSVPAVVTEVEDSYRLHRRFDRMGRLVGDSAMERLFASKVMVIGVGGVGSFAAETLARAGVGKLVLVDFDKVCITNTNRQLQAMKGTIGKHKVHVLADRLRLVNPQAEVVALPEFYNKETSEALLAQAPDFVIDCIDNLTAKCHLLATCQKRGIRVISSMGAAGRMDPTKIVLADLAETTVDKFADAVRRILREKYEYPSRGRFDIPTVYSTERTRDPIELHYDNGEGFRCVCPGGKNDLHSCEERRVIYGTAPWITGAFGMYAASIAIRSITG